MARIYRIRTDYPIKYIALLAVCNFLDGLISILSLGFMGSTFGMDVHYKATKYMITKLKRHHTEA